MQLFHPQPAAAQEEGMVTGRPDHICANDQLIDGVAEVLDDTDNFLTIIGMDRDVICHEDVTRSNLLDPEAAPGYPGVYSAYHFQSR
jgi:hypothetical protein